MQRLEAVVDNDVLIKASSYRVLAPMAGCFASAHSVGILAAARFVVGRRLERNPIHDRAAAIAHWTSFLASVERLEPTDEEVTLATLIEEAASEGGLALDSGESQLFAIAIVRSIERVLTGDKRAIASAEALLPRVPAMQRLKQRLVCLEQALLALIGRVPAAQVRALVCTEPAVDKALSICFECSDPAPREQFSGHGLQSYIEDLRRSAPILLAPSPATD